VAKKTKSAPQKKTTPRQTRAVARLEKQLQIIDPESTRAHLIKCTINFRRSWIDLGFWLSNVAQGGDYAEWGFVGFDEYCAGELGIKKQTVNKLVSSYRWLQKHEPARLAAVHRGEDVFLPDHATVYELEQTANAVDETVGKEEFKQLRERVMAGDGEEGALRKELQAARRQPPLPDAERHAAIAKLRHAMRTVRKLAAEAEAVPEGLRERLDRLLAEMEALE
jgi:hypothetical protein